MNRFGNTHYKLRANSIYEVGFMLCKIECDDVSINRVYVGDFALHQVECSFRSPLGLDALRAALSDMPLGHVMSATVNIYDDYDGCPVDPDAR